LGPGKTKVLVLAIDGVVAVVAGVEVKLKAGEEVPFVALVLALAEAAEAAGRNGFGLLTPANGVVVVPEDAKLMEFPEGLNKPGRVAPIAGPALLWVEAGGCGRNGFGLAAAPEAGAVC
jgi:hypothetical protein